MGIRVTCPNGHALNVKEHLAGKRGICPSCGAKFVIPPATASVEAASVSPGITAAGTAVTSESASLSNPSVIIPIADASRPAASQSPERGPATMPPAVQAVPTAREVPNIAPTPAVNTDVDRSVSPAIKYVAHRERARRNRTRIAVLLLFAVIVLAAVLVWILVSGPPAISRNKIVPNDPTRTLVTSGTLLEGFRRF
jgi:hypothetical protein